MRSIFSPMTPRFKNIRLIAQDVLQSHFIDWRQGLKPLYDLLDESKAEYLFCEQNRLSEEVISVVHNTNIKLVLFGVGIPERLSGYEDRIVLCYPSNITSNVKKQIEQLDARTVRIANCANVADLGNKEINIRADIGFLSATEPTQYSSFDLVLESLRYLGMNLPESMTFKCVGPVNVEIPEFLGYIDTNQFDSFYKNTTINIDFEGKGLLDAAINNSFCISNTPNGLYPHFNSFGDLMHLIDVYVNDPEKRKEKAQTAFDNIVKQDTSLHRLADIFTAVERPDLANYCVSKIQKIKGL